MAIKGVSALGHRLPHGSYVTQWRRSVHPCVFPAELRRALISHSISRGSDIEEFHEHQTTSLVETKLFLVLHRCHRCHSLEVMMQRRDTHPDALGQLPDTQRLHELFPKPANCLGNFITRCLIHRNLHQAWPKWPCHEAIENFLFDQWRHHWNIVGSVEKP